MIKIILLTVLHFTPALTNSLSIDLHLRKSFESNEFEGYRQTNQDVKLSNLFDDLYNGEIYIGSPLQKILVAFDTASSDIVVPSIHCTEIDIKCIHTRYTGEESLYYNPLFRNVSFDIGGIGHMEGSVAEDMVTVFGTVAELQFAEITTMSSEFWKRARFDGLFGLGFPSLSNIEATPPLLKLFEEKHKDLPKSFSLWFERRPYFIPYHIPDFGRILLGAPQTQLCHTEKLAYAKVLNEKYWEISLDSIKFGNETLCDNCSAIIDTKHPFISGPSQQIQKINELLMATKVNDVSVIDCEKEYPNFFFLLQNQIFNLGDVDFIMKKFINGANVCISPFVEGSPHNMDQHWTIGLIFLTRYYTFYDYENLQFGIQHMK